MRKLFALYDRLTQPIFPFAQSAFLLAIRLYWGWQLTQTGWGKLHHLANVTEYFQGLGVPMAAFNARFVGGLELVGGILLVLGLANRLSAVPLTINFIVAYWFGDHDALLAIFKDPGTFYGAAPFTFLFVSAVVLLFGPGLFSIDALIRRVLTGKNAIRAADKEFSARRVAV